MPSKIGKQQLVHLGPLKSASQILTFNKSLILLTGDNRLHRRSTLALENTKIILAYLVIPSMSQEESAERVLKYASQTLLASFSNLPQEE